MSEHLKVTSEEYFRIRERYIGIWGEPLRSAHFSAVKAHIAQYHAGLRGEELTAQLASHQVALMLGQIKLRDLLSPEKP